MTTTVIPSTAPLAFHLLARPTRWWRPVLVLVTALALYVALLAAPTLALVTIAAVHPPAESLFDRLLGSGCT